MSDRSKFGAGMDREEDDGMEPLQSSLDQWTQPKAREEFRAQLRKRFLKGAAGSSRPEPELSGDGQPTAFGAGVWDARDRADLDVNRTPVVTNEDAVANTTHVSNTVKQFESVLDAWAPETPKPAFREQMRERFLSAGNASSAPLSQVHSSAGGPLASDPESAESMDAGPEEPQGQGRAANLRPVTAAGPDQRRGRRTAPSRRAPVSARSQRRRTWSIVGGAAALAAAAVIAMIWIPGGTAAPAASGWSLLAGGQVAQFDGQALEAPGDGQLAVAGSPKIVTAGDETLRLQFLDQMVLELEPGSSLDISDLTEEGHADDGWILTMSGDSGGYRVATMAGFRRDDRRLTFRTPDADVEVVGTVFGIDRYVGREVGPDGTCVCCCDGEVRVTSRSNGQSGAVVSGTSNYVHSESGAQNPMPKMPGPHAKPLEVLASAYHNK